MKTNNKLSLLLLLTLTAAPCVNADAIKTANFPPDLKFNNKPIDPLCFFNLEGNAGEINLQKCGLNDKYKVTGKNKFLLSQGFYGFDWKDPTVSYPSGGSSYYKAWKAEDNHYWVYTMNNGGGSGDFTAINLYSRKDPNTVKLQTIQDGDRCNGGISNVIESGTGIQYSSSITAFDFIALAKDNPHNLKAYDDLSACAACCAAKAVYSVDSKLQPQLLYVDLGKNAKVNQMQTQGKYHECFNNLFASYVSKGKTKLNDAELSEFVKKFNDTCVK